MLLKWCRGLFFHIYHWNFASNFFLYYLTGEKFKSVVIEKLNKFKKSITLKIFWCKCCVNHLSWCKCNASRFSWCKCSDQSKSVQTPSVLLMKVVAFNESSINGSITPECNGNVTSIT